MGRILNIKNVFPVEFYNFYYFTIVVEDICMQFGTKVLNELRLCPVQKLDYRSECGQIHVYSDRQKAKTEFFKESITPFGSSRFILHSHSCAS